MSTDRIICGIDPGSRTTGYGVIKVQGNRFSLLQYGVVELGDNVDSAEKLGKLHTSIQDVLRLNKVQEVAIESPFYGKNAQSMLKLARAQGVAMAVAALRDLRVCEYAPMTVKKAVAGQGRAGKEQVARMLQHLLPGVQIPRSLDAMDALAVALCHAIKTNTLGR